MLGPGRYEPEITEGITRVEDLPEPMVVRKKNRGTQNRGTPYSIQSRNEQDAPVIIFMPRLAGPNQHASTAEDQALGALD